MGELTRLEVLEEAMTLVFTNPSPPPTRNPFWSLPWSAQDPQGHRTSYRSRGGLRATAWDSLWELICFLGKLYVPGNPAHVCRPGQPSKISVGSGGRLQVFPVPKGAQGGKQFFPGLRRESELTGSADGASGHLAELRGPWRPQFPCHTMGPGCRSLALGTCWGKPV